MGIRLWLERNQVRDEEESLIKHRRDGVATCRGPPMGGQELMEVMESIRCKKSKLLIEMQCIILLLPSFQSLINLLLVRMF